MTKGKCDQDGTDRALRTFRIRECLDELPDPEVGDLETAVRLAEEALINLEFILRDRTANLRVTTPVIPDRVGTSIANTNPDYASDDKFPLGYPIGVNIFFSEGRQPTLEEKLLLAINESEKGSPLRIRSGNQKRIPGIPQVCAECRAVFCKGCSALSEETKFWVRLQESRSTALSELSDLRKWIRKDLLPWMRRARFQLKSNRMIRWYHKITHER